MARRGGPIRPSGFLTGLLGAVAVLALSAGPLPAEEGPKILYTPLDPQGPNCSLLPPESARAGTLVCWGLGSYELAIGGRPEAEGVVFGHVEVLPEATNYLPVAPLPGARPGKTVEWLLEKLPGEPEELAWQPFAAILRFHTRPDAGDSNEDSGSGEGYAGQVLTVVRITPGETCAVAHVDARANREANALARQAALERARDFRCGQDEARPYGTRGRSF